VPPPPKPFPRPDITVNCLADGVNTQLFIEDKKFHGIMYVKGHSHNPACRRTVDPIDTADLVEFTVKFGTCGLFHFNVSLCNLYQARYSIEGKTIFTINARSKHTQDHSNFC